MKLITFSYVADIKFIENKTQHRLMILMFLVVMSLEGQYLIVSIKNPGFWDQPERDIAVKNWFVSNF